MKKELLIWGSARVQDKNYYRDLAIHIDIMEGFKQTVAFTHASIVTNIDVDTEADIVTIHVTANQKRDKFVGVAFGDELQETIQKAKDRVANPPRINIVLPMPKVNNEDVFLSMLEVNNEDLILVKENSDPIPEMIPLGYNYVTRNKKLEFEPKHIDQLDSDAFKHTITTFYSCNTGYLGEKSFAQKWANKTGSLTYAYNGTTDYTVTLQVDSSLIVRLIDGTFQLSKLIIAAGEYQLVPSERYPIGSPGVEEIEFKPIS